MKKKNEWELKEGYKVWGICGLEMPLNPVPMEITNRDSVELWYADYKRGLLVTSREECQELCDKLNKAIEEVLRNER